MYIKFIEKTLRGSKYLKKILSLICFIFFDNPIYLLFKIFNNKSINDNVVYIIKTDAIGDFFIWMHSAQNLREIYPDNRIILIANSAWSDYASTLNYWDSVIPINRSKFMLNLFYRFSMLYQFSNIICQVILNTTYSREFGCNDIIVRFMNSSSKIGFKGDSLNSNFLLKKISDNWYSELVENQDNLKNIMQLHHHFLDYLSPLRRLSNKTKLIDYNYSASKYSLNKNYIVVNPSASWSGRKWPSKNFSSLIDYIHLNSKYQIVICGGREDKSLSEEITLRCLSKPINLAGLTNIQDYVNIIQNSYLVISNESSALHIAYFFDVNSIGMVGGGHYGIFTPYPPSINSRKSKQVILSAPMECFGCNWNCIFKEREPVPCISNITLSCAIQSLKAFL